MRLIPLLLLFLSPIFAYSQTLSDAELQDLLSNGILVHSVSSQSEMKQYFGDPIETKTKKIDNPYSEVSDLVTHFVYPGIEIIFYDCNNPENKWEKIVSVAVKKNQFALKYNISPGLGILDIEKLFQGRDRERWDSEGLTYVSFSMPDSAHEQIVFASKNEIVQEVIWSNWP